MDETKGVTKKEKHEVSTGEEFSVKSSMDEIEPRLPQIGIIHQGQLFLMPDGEKIQDFEGIILDLNRANAYWQESFSESGGGTPPDCSSLDGINADLNSDDCPSLTGQCGSGPKPECPMNQFGSAGRGKACKNLKRVHIILDGHQLPLRLTLPPTSIKALDLYVSLLASTGLAYQKAVTKFSLKETQNKEGIKYSEIVLSKVSETTDDKRIAELKAMYRSWKPIMRGQVIKADEYY